MTKCVVAIIVTGLMLGRSYAAESRDHWSFRSPRRASLPVIRDHGWPLNAIDYFILAELEARSLTPSPRADQAALQRRVTLDLTGIPPAVSEMAREESQADPAAYQRIVSKLIDSPRFGERMATPWLDAARYADTHGFLIDAHREMWPWRDWVIGAFNRNLPYDQFTRDQIAGDLIPNATFEQRIASGFNRNHMINYENGADAEEYRVEYVVDRAATTANVWLGLTFQCARCHDHKYDPISLTEFYQWYAFFNNVPEKGLDGNLGNAAPLTLAPTAEQQRQLAILEQRLSATEATLQKKQMDALARISEWESSLRDRPEVLEEPRDALLKASFETIEQMIERPGNQTLPPKVHGDPNLAAGRRGKAIVLNGRTHVEIPSVKWPRNGAGWTFAAWVFPTTSDAMNIATLVDIREQPRVEFAIEELQPRIRFLTGNGTVEFLSNIRLPLKLQRWQHLAVAWDGTKTGQPHWFVDGLPVSAEPSANNQSLPVLFSGNWRVGSDGGQVGFRGMLDEFQIFSRELSNDEAAGLANANPIEAALAVPLEQRSTEQEKLLCDTYLRRDDPAYGVLASERTQVQRELTAIRRAIPTAMIMQEDSSRRPTFVLRRGKYNLPGKQVEPGTPSVLPRFPADLPRNRLGLAQWLVRPDHPLTARVMVDRLWRNFFGNGLVPTPDDYGLRGERPTHPELLDWLAAEFVDSGWDVKHIVRLIVSSATYQQSSHVDRDMLVRDPENRWLNRAPRLRLEAEMVRDSLLAVSGLLDQRIGGPSVYPYQPSGLWEEVSFNPAEFSAQTYLPSHGADLYRRGIYSFWKRTLPPPSLTLFDAPTRETCVAVRSRSNTPLQALMLMNDPLAIEAARHLAARAMLQADGPADSIAGLLFEHATGRAATPAERQELADLFERQQKRFRETPDKAKHLLSVGESPRDERLNAVDHAAWTAVANVVLCLDETITRN